MKIQSVKNIAFYVSVAIPFACQNKPGVVLDFSGSRLEVIINGKSYANNATYNWGNVSSGAAIIVEGQLRNQSPFAVTLAGATPLSLSGDHASDIALTQPVSSVLAAGATQKFALTITPQALQARSAKITIISTPGNDVYTLNLTGYRYGLSLIKDINSGVGSSSPAHFTMVGTKLYFDANNGTNGIEPWISDGTTNGTTMIADINPGAGSSIGTPRFFQFGNMVLFRADDGSLGDELWRTDGTTGGTYLVKDINTGSGGSTVNDFCAFNGKVYFQADTAANGDELWRTDGSYLGTSLVTDLYSGTSNGNGGDMFAYNSNFMIFSGNTAATGYELYRMNTSDAVSLAHNLDGGTANSSPTGFFAFNGATVFRANSQIWKLTAATPGTATAFKSVSPSNFRILGDKLIFIGLEGTYGQEIWASDSSLTSGGTAILKDIQVGSTNSSPASLTVAGDKLFFHACETATDCELWVTDGSTSGTVRVMDINPGAGASSSPSSMVAIGNVVYFSANDGTNGAELWRSDGTVAGTYMITDINAGATSSSPTSLTVFGAGFYFSATTAANGTELYMYVPPP